MLTKGDITGVYPMVPTPCVEGGDHWSNTDSVDHDESARMIDAMVRAGIGGIAACGTTGECASLLWEEKRGFIDTVIQTNNHRVPVFAGATALGTKEVVRQMRAFKEMGAEGAFLGLPLWQTPTLENSVRYFADLGEAVPDMPILVYANAWVFKWGFPTEFWEGLALRAPTVVACKVTYPMDHLEEDVRAAGNRIAFLPRDGAAHEAYQKVGRHIQGVWSTSANAGPEPVVALADAVRRGDEQRMAEITREMAPLRPLPTGRESEFFQYNIQVIKLLTNVSGYAKVGPPRAPYLDLSEEWRTLTERCGRGWAELRKKYIKTTV